MKKVLLTLAAISITSSFFLFPLKPSAQAAGLKVRPARIEVEAGPGVLIEQELTIENPDGNVALFEVYPDNFSDWIKVKPESFTLESGKSQTVLLKIRSQEKGIFSATISVVAKPMSERQFKANSGVKIPLLISIDDKEKGFFLADVSRALKSPWASEFAAGLILVIAFAVIYVKRKRKTLKEHYDSPGISIDSSFCKK